MKHLNKVVSLLLALVMVLSLGVSAFATTQPEQSPEPRVAETGSVTINGALKGNNLTLYKIFDLESYSGENYAYTIDSNSPLFSTIQGMKLKTGTMTTEANVFSLTEGPKTTVNSTEVTTYYVQLNNGFKGAPDNGEAVKAIASKLMGKIDTLGDAQKQSLSMKQVAKLGGTGNNAQTTRPKVTPMTST